MTLQVKFIMIIPLHLSDSLMILSLSKVKKIYLDEKRLLAGDHSIDLLLRDFKKNYHMYVYPVHWQFSERDQHPRDR